MHIPPVVVCMPTYKRWDLLESKNHPIHRIAREQYIKKVFVLNQNEDKTIPESFLTSVQQQKWVSKLYVFHTPSNYIDNRITLMQSCAGYVDYILSIDDDYMVTPESIRTCLEYLIKNDSKSIYAGFVPRFMSIKRDLLLPKVEYHGRAANAKESIINNDKNKVTSLKIMKTPYNLLLTGASIVNPNMLIDDESRHIREFVSAQGNGEDIYTNFVIAKNLIRLTGNANFLYFHSILNKTWKYTDGPASQAGISSETNHLIKRFRLFKKCIDHFGLILPTSNAYIET